MRFSLCPNPACDHGERIDRWVLDQDGRLAGAILTCLGCGAVYAHQTQGREGDSLATLHPLEEIAREG